jgi:purine-binding chemotaxis protein CheW
MAGRGTGGRGGPQSVPTDGSSDLVSETASSLSLVFRAGARLCALPVSRVVEVHRPLPVESVSQAPPAVLGFAIIRGAALPVVDLAVLLGSHSRGACTRFVIVRAGERRFALSVETVLGIREFAPPFWGDLPPLLGPASAELIEAVGALDADAILALQAGHIVPDAVWDRLSRQEAS